MPLEAATTGEGAFGTSRGNGDALPVARRRLLEGEPGTGDVVVPGPFGVKSPTLGERIRLSVAGD